MKGSILPGHIPVNKYQMQVNGLPQLTPTNIGGLEEELNVIEMPDRTNVSGGNTGPSETTVTIPAHHSVEVLAMEAWFREGQDPVTPTYKKVATLIMESVGLVGTRRTYTLNGVFVKKRKTSDLELKNDGDMAVNEYTLSIDEIIPTG